MIELDHINYIDSELMKTMCHPIAVELYDSKVDPMTKFDEHERSLLDSALNNPRQAFGGNDFYPTLTRKAAILYYSLIKNHPFKNGNKRTATVTLLVFLHINNSWLRGKTKKMEDYLVELARRVANSKGSAEMEDFLSEIEYWLTNHLETKGSL